MIVLDYKRKMIPYGNDMCINIPTFHRGHLGFIPGVEIELYHRMSSADPGHMEVIITPVPQNKNKTCKISCIIEDKPGALSLLARAISELKVNIVTMESSTINHYKFHKIEMVLDWEGSGISCEEESPPNIQDDLNDYQSILPINLQCYVLLFKEILVRCGKLIPFDTIGGVSLPRIGIHPLHIPDDLHSEGSVIIERSIDDDTVIVKFPKQIVELIRSKLSLSDDDDIYYILSSETEEKRLRVFFPKNEMIGQMIHVGICHIDEKGVISLILQLLAKSGFSIITSLLRKIRINTNVLELYLEYKGSDKIWKSLDRADFTRVHTFIKQKLVTALTNNAEKEMFEKYEIKVGFPFYPKKKHC